MCSGEKAANWKGGKRITKDGYVAIYSPHHPFAKRDKTVLEHRLIMEKIIGRFLQPFEIVHHKNGIKDDNRIENLILTTQAEHIKLEWKIGSMINSKKTQFKKGMIPWDKNKKLSLEHKLKCIKTLTPFKKGHKYFPRKALG